MKTERRHELQHNALADWLGQQTEAWRPYARAIIGGFVLTAALLFALSAMRGSQKQKQAKSWNEYFAAAAADDVQGLRGLSDIYPRTKAAAWGLQRAADLSLAKGASDLFRDRGDATELLKEAREDYEAAFTLAKSDMLKQRALMGLAQTYEALNDLEGAKSTYERVLSQWPDSALSKSAQDRMAFLDRSSTREFSEWFVKQQPKPKPDDPLSGTIQTPSVYGDLPSDPTVTLPDATELERSSGRTDGAFDVSPMTPPEEGMEEVPATPDIDTGAADPTATESTPSTDGETPSLEEDSDLTPDSAEDESGAGSAT